MKAYSQYKQNTLSLDARVLWLRYRDIVRSHDIEWDDDLRSMDDDVEKGQHLPAYPFVLIEHSSRTGQDWVTVWASPEEAVRYHFGQEYTEDWAIVDIVDLRSLEHFEATHSARKVG